MADSFSPAERSRIMAAVKSKNTTPELRVRRLVHKLGYRFRLHDRQLPGTPDLVLRRHGAVIVVNGCFWHLHNCPRCRIPAANRDYWVAKLQRNAARDRRNVAQLRRLGWRVLVVWECQTQPDKLPALQRRLTKFLAAAE